MRILIAEDDSILAEGLQRTLRHSGHAVDWVNNGGEADAALGTHEFDLLILDISLPKLSGFEVLKRLRARNSTLPVLLLTALDSVDDRVRGLDAGADDYLAKPFNPHELTARVAAILRRVAPRGQQPEEGILSLGGGRLVLDPVTRRFELAAAGQDARAGRLTPGEARLVVALARHPGTVLTREQLLEEVARRPDEVYDRVVDVHVANLRRKLGDDAGAPWLIETVPQVGYRLVAGRDAT